MVNPYDPNQLKDLFNDPKFEKAKWQSRRQSRPKAKDNPTIGSHRPKAEFEPLVNTAKQQKFEQPSGAKQENEAPKYDPKVDEPSHNPDQLKDILEALEEEKDQEKKEDQDPTPPTIGSHRP